MRHGHIPLQLLSWCLARAGVECGGLERFACPEHPRPPIEVCWHLTTPSRAPMMMPLALSAWQRIPAESKG